MQTYPPLYSLKSEVRVVPCPPPLAGNHIPGAYLVDRSSSDNVATLCSDWARQVSTRRSCSAMLTTSPITPRSAADSENCCAAGGDGVDLLSRTLNVFFTTLISCVHAHGGDVIKFAGDALIICWSTQGPTAATASTSTASLGQQGREGTKFNSPTPRYASLADAAVAAARCGITLSRETCQCLDHELTLHVGVASGEITYAVLGGVDHRCELIIDGPPMLEMGLAEGFAGAGELVVSTSMHRMLEGRFAFGRTEVAEGVGGDADGKRVFHALLDELVPLPGT